MLPMGAWVEVLSAFGRTVAVGLPLRAKWQAAYELLVCYRPLANCSLKVAGACRLDVWRRRPRSGRRERRCVRESRRGRLGYYYFQSYSHGKFKNYAIEWYLGNRASAGLARFASRGGAAADPFGAPPAADTEVIQRRGAAPAPVPAAAPMDRKGR